MFVVANYCQVNLQLSESKKKTRLQQYSVITYRKDLNKHLKIQQYSVYS